MATMYEMLMGLPLLKGVGKEQVSLFLEKTNIAFTNYIDGDVIVSRGEEAKMVKFVIKGEVSVSHNVSDGSIIVEEIAGTGRVFGADRLFGITKGYPYEVRSIGKTSIMEFSKQQYVTLLNSNWIYLLNFFNYLSLRAQRPVELLQEYGEGTIQSRLSLLVGIITSPDAIKITIRAGEESLADYCATDVRTLRRWKKDMQDGSIIKCAGDKINLLSRLEFLSQCREKPQP